MAQTDVVTAPGVAAHVRDYLVAVTDLYRSHDVDRLLDELLTPDAAFIDHRPLGAEPIIGADAVRLWLTTLFEMLPDWQISVEVLAQQGDVYLARDRYTGHAAGGGGPAEMEWYVVDTLRGAKLAREEIFADEHAARAAYKAGL